MRDYTVRLYAGELQIRGGNTSVPARFADFTRLYAGHWVPGERRGRLAVLVDTSDAPETAKWAEAAKQLCEIWHPIIFDRLYPGNRAPARTIKMIFKRHRDGYAIASACLDCFTAELADQPAVWPGIGVAQQCEFQPLFMNTRPGNRFASGLTTFH